MRDWPSSSLKRHAKITYGLGQPPPEADDGVPILRATNIHRGKFMPDGLMYARYEDLPLDRAPLLEHGEILVVRSGAYTGDSALVTQKWAGCAPGYDLRVTPDARTDSRFVAYSLLSTRALDAMRIASSRAAQPHLNAEELGEVMITWPPREQQRAIADYLDAETARIDALVTKKRRMIDLLAEDLGGRTDELIGNRTHDLVPLKHLVLSDRPIMYGIVLPGPDVDDGVLLVKGGSVKPENLSPERLARTATEIEARYARSRLRAGDLVFAIRGGVGDVEIVPRSIDGANITQDVARISPGSMVDRHYLLHALRAPGTQREVAKRVTGATIRGINIWELDRLPVPLPDREEQQSIASHLGALARRHEVLHSKLSRQIDLLAEHRQALITAAVTGEFQVPEVAA